MKTWHRRNYWVRATEAIVLVAEELMLLVVGSTTWGGEPPSTGPEIGDALSDPGPLFLPSDRNRTFGLR